MCTSCGTTGVPFDVLRYVWLLLQFLKSMSTVIITFAMKFCRVFFIIIIGTLFLTNVAAKNVPSTAQPVNTKQPTTYPYLPNLFFVGASKCGTSTLASVLVSHPLFAAVGSINGEAEGEARIFNRYDLTHKDMKTLQRKRLDEQFAKLIPSQALAIRETGVTMHYTPHYMMSRRCMTNLCSVMKMEGQRCRDQRYLVTVRNPVSRTISSWWYKGLCYTDTPKPFCARFENMMTEGMHLAKSFEACVISQGMTIDDLVRAVRVQHTPKRYRAVLRHCPLSLLTKWGRFGDDYKSHIGKSIYVYQLLQLFAHVPRDQTYIMVLEDFAKDPLRELELLFDWLGVPLYATEHNLGFNSSDFLRNLTHSHKTNVHLIPADVMKNTVDPVRPKLDNFFHQSNKQLEHLLDYDPSGPTPAYEHNHWSNIAMLTHRRQTHISPGIQQEHLPVSFASGDGTSVSSGSVLRTRSKAVLATEVASGSTAASLSPPLTYLQIPLESSKASVIHKVLSIVAARRHYFEKDSPMLVECIPPAVPVNSRVIVFIVEPVEHVKTLYSQCVSTLKSSGSPHHMPTFTQYLQHFATGSPTASTASVGGNSGLSSCANPKNDQVTRLNGLSATRVWHLGMAEHIYHSACVLYFQFFGYIPPRCRCSFSGGSGDEKVADTLQLYRDNTTVGVRTEDIHMTLEDRKIIDILTDKDSDLYDQAKLEFSRRVTIVELETGHKICEAV